MSVQNDMERLMIRLQILFDKALEESYGHCKSGEPSLKISLSNDNKWYAEIYSYLVDYTPHGGRHHEFWADTYEDLIRQLDKAILEQEKNYGLVK